MVDSRTKIRLKYSLAIVWLSFTLSFAIWWMYFVLTQLKVMIALAPDHLPEFERHRRMMLWEGSAWMVLLLAGGGTLIWFVAREAHRARELKEFFAAFSHDIKTSLASLRLQAESLKEDLVDRELPVLDRLVSDTVRLNLQLQNSLFLASSEDLKLYVEELRLSEIVAGLRVQWPQLELEVPRDCIVKGDERALQSVLANLIHNSVVHGAATRFRLAPMAGSDLRVKLEFADNGSGFSGDPKNLAKLFHRHSSGSGSGVGLYISRELIERMQGRLTFSPRPKGFAGQLELEGRLL
jgi:signal transduction histidine kinase